MLGLQYKSPPTILIETNKWKIRSMSSIQIAIIGASGYGAGELLRLLVNHPAADVRALISSSSDAEIGELHPQLSKKYRSLQCISTLSSDVFDYEHSNRCIFVALPHGKSGAVALELLNRRDLGNIKIIDLSGDLRLTNRTAAERWYPETSFDKVQKAGIVYGLTEFNRPALSQARIVANPGCLASAAIIGLKPLIHSLGDIENIVIDAKTGTSGGGRTPQSAFHHPAMHSNCFSYKVLEHRHEPEICQALGIERETADRLAFVPSVIPSSRGIYVNSYLLLKESVSQKLVDSIMESAYRDESFIRIRSQAPELRNVLSSNFCDVYATVRGRTIVTISALDNLVKGMAGSAIQNMNVMFGLPEETGLELGGLGIT
jgi:N-acetyl-gamma-glutamyl-phosphate reductase